jgi:glycerol-3-phosphate acyltransferase PlsY
MLDFVLLAGVGALIGHCFPVWLRFKGGKGVATMLGVSLAFDWRIGLASAVVWLVTALITRISSLGGMASAVAAPVTAFSIYATIDPSGGVFLSGFLERMVWFYTGLALLLMSAIVVFQHRANIARLIKGTEPKIGAGKQ